MGDYYQMTIDDWLASKTEEIRQEMNKAAQSFVAIGYKLREVRDSGNLSEGETITDYAKREFGLSASTTSRFIAISEKFGNGLDLKNEYIGIGSAKLQEMLTLSDADCELITRNTTVNQIREVKAFERETHEELKAEVVEEVQYGAFEKCIIDYFKDKPKLLNDICGHPYYDTEDFKAAAELLSPNGSTTHKKGIIFLFMYGFDDGIKYKVFGEREPRTMSYIEFIETIRHIFECEEGVNPHEAFFGVEQKEEKKVENTGNQLQQSEKVQEETDKSQELATNSQGDAYSSRDEAIGLHEDDIVFGEDASGEPVDDCGEDTTGTGRGDVSRGPESKSKVFEESEKATSTMGEINEEVEDENDNDNGIARQNDYTDEAEADDEVEHVEVAAVEDFTEKEADAIAEDIEHDADPRKKLIDDLEYYCNELVMASKWPIAAAERFRSRSDELIDFILEARKDLLLMNFKLKQELDEDEDEFNTKN